MNRSSTARRRGTVPARGPRTRCLRPALRSRPAFTLIEVLTVIAIIGILVGLLVPAINVARHTILQRAIALETQTLADAVEKYRQKYNDFPPDGTSLQVVVAHLRKAFPQIAASEINLLTTDTFPGNSVPLVNQSIGSPTGVMDPAEAIVFFLGGFSSDPIYPLSGVGGPFFITDTSGNQVTSSVPPNQRGSVQYNPDRNEPLFDFNQSQLTLAITTTTVSDDETRYGLGANNDCIPVYRPRRREAPFVYFDARTYSIPVGTSRFYNYYGSANAPFGVVRPYRSDQKRTNTSDFERMYRYMAEDSFQLISAGLDDLFGGIPYNGTGGGPVFYAYPSGTSIDFGPTPSSAPNIGQYGSYQDGSGGTAQLDNVSNFSEGTFADALPN